jgi:polysaccharide biosynthesis protein PelA
MRIAFVIVALLVLGGTLWWFVRARPMKWIVYYGRAVTASELQGVSLAVLEPDHIIPVELPFARERKTQFIAYLSVGEVHESRLYWLDIEKKPYNIEENPDWPGAHRIDIRAQEWQDRMLDELIPSFITKGYQGVFLDTIDTAMYLEDADPERFAGSKLAMVKFIRQIHARFPDLHIYPNNGFQYLAKYQDVIAGVIVEDLYTRHKVRRGTSGTLESYYEKTPIAETRYKEGLLSQCTKPIYVLLYDQTADGPVARYGMARAKKQGYGWYWSTVELQTIGVTN